MLHFDLGTTENFLGGREAFHRLFLLTTDILLSPHSCFLESPFPPATSFWSTGQGGGAGGVKEKHISADINMFSAGQPLGVKYKYMISYMVYNIQKVQKSNV